MAVLEADQNARVIPLSQGKFAIVDSDDYKKFASLTWTFSGAYAKRAVKKPFKRAIWLHREIAKTPVGKITDHINGNSLDNRKANLRWCSHQENLRNSKLRKDNSVGIKGVRLRKPWGTYYTTIRVDGKYKWLGSFRTKEAAGEAYAKAAIKYYGKFARV